VPADEMSLQVGKEGEAFTVLRPPGKVRIDGKIYDAVAEFGFIEAQEKIVVIRSESGCLYVRSLSPKA
ncbi:MAG: NfeD family protein, partial [Bacteroidales bacterium]|nr:NfeD family protein [Bacteroidales bacterium]